MKLFINRIEAHEGMQVTTFRGDKAILIGWTEPKRKGSSGRVRIQEGKFICDYFPGVIGGEFKD